MRVGGYGTYAVRDDVGMTVETSFGIAVGAFVAGQVPDYQGFVTAAGEEHVGVFEGGG